MQIVAFLPINTLVLLFYIMTIPNIPNRADATNNGIAAVVAALQFPDQAKNPKAPSLLDVIASS